MFEYQPLLYQGEPALERWLLFYCRYFTVWLHKFVMTEREGYYHVHPFWLVKIILWRGYVEWLLPLAGGTPRRRNCLPGMIVYQGRSIGHRVLLRGERPSWSICICGPNDNQSVFYKDDQRLTYNQYMNQRRTKE
jgi:hypothetical protein